MDLYGTRQQCFAGIENAGKYFRADRPMPASYIGMTIGQEMTAAASQPRLALSSE